VRWTPTHWQASLFPQNLKSDLLIQHEGVDTRTIRPNPEAKATLPDGTTTLKSAERLNLYHRFIFHTGDAVTAKIEAAWQEYAKETK
jgi:hypothetical protein